MSVNVVKVNEIAKVVGPSLFRWHPTRLSSVSRKEHVVMTKTIDAITEIIRNTKHTFRKADDRPVKAQKHRYERRKIKEYIRLSHWGQESPA